MDERASKMEQAKKKIIEAQKSGYVVELRREVKALQLALRKSDYAYDISQSKLKESKRIKKAKNGMYEKSRVINGRWKKHKNYCDNKKRYQYNRW